MGGGDPTLNDSLVGAIAFSTDLIGR
jgi:hypothetical protein